jgi:hypothetical protein
MVHGGSIKRRSTVMGLFSEMSDKHVIKTVRSYG